MPTHIFLPLVNRADSARGIITLWPAMEPRWFQRLGPMAWFFNGFGTGRRSLGDLGDQLPGWRPWPHPERSWGAATGAAEAAEAAESLDSLDSKASGAGWVSESPAFSASDPGAAMATSPGGATPVPSVLSPRQVNRTVKIVRRKRLRVVSMMRSAQAI